MMNGITDEDRKLSWTARYIMPDDPNYPGWSWCLFRGDRFLRKGVKRLQDLLYWAELCGITDITVIGDGSHEY